MAYGDKKNAADNVNKMWEEVGSYTQTMNKTFEPKPRVNIFPLFE